jgi:hypothetical protein
LAVPGTANQGGPLRKATAARPPSGPALRFYALGLSVETVEGGYEAVYQQHQSRIFNEIEGERKNFMG